MTVSRFASILVALTCVHIFANPLETACTQADGDAWIETGNSLASPFRVAGRADICATGFELFEDPETSATYLFAAPLELGLRARRQVFRLDYGSGRSTLIGELPASAESTGSLAFVDLFQQGGSIFQDRYTVASSGVLRDPTSFELVFEGVVCIKSNSTCRPNISSCTDCKSIKATRLVPICLKHLGGTSLVLHSNACRDLMVLVE